MPLDPATWWEVRVLDRGRGPGWTYLPTDDEPHDFDSKEGAEDVARGAAADSPDAMVVIVVECHAQEVARFTAQP